jgi:hypothetical protein
VISVRLQHHVSGFEMESRPRCSHGKLKLGQAPSDSAAVQSCRDFAKAIDHCV